MDLWILMEGNCFFPVGMVGLTTDSLLAQVFQCWPWRLETCAFHSWQSGDCRKNQRIKSIN
jgi:hypothetical protein